MRARKKGAGDNIGAGGGALPMGEHTWHCHIGKAEGWQDRQMTTAVPTKQDLAGAQKAAGEKAAAEAASAGEGKA